MIDTGRNEWGSAVEAACRAGIPVWAVRRLAKVGAIGVKQIPCGRPRYSIPDCVRIAEESVRPARIRIAAVAPPREEVI